MRPRALAASSAWPRPGRRGRRRGPRPRTADLDQRLARRLPDVRALVTHARHEGATAGARGGQGHRAAGTPLRPGSRWHPARPPPPVSRSRPGPWPRASAGRDRSLDGGQQRAQGAPPPPSIRRAAHAGSASPSGTEGKQRCLRQLARISTSALRTSTFWSPTAEAKGSMAARPIWTSASWAARRTTSLGILSRARRAPPIAHCRLGQHPGARARASGMGRPGPGHRAQRAAPDPDQGVRARLAHPRRASRRVSHSALPPGIPTAPGLRRRCPHSGLGVLERHTEGTHALALRPCPASGRPLTSGGIPVRSFRSVTRALREVRQKGGRF